MSMNNFKATVDKFEKNQAVVLIGGHEILLPTDILPNDVREGMILHISINSDLETEKKQEDLAKEMLNEILGNS